MQRIKVFYHQEPKNDELSWFSKAGEDRVPTYKEFLTDYVCVLDRFVPQGQQLGPEDMYHLLNIEFVEYLIDQAVVRELRTHTSMSVGDVVMIDNIIYICLPSEWAILLFDT